MDPAKTGEEQLELDESISDRRVVDCVIYGVPGSIYQISPDLGYDVDPTFKERKSRDLPDHNELRNLLKRQQFEEYVEDEDTTINFRFTSDPNNKCLRFSSRNNTDIDVFVIVFSLTNRPFFDSMVNLRLDELRFFRPHRPRLVIATDVDDQYVLSGTKGMKNQTVPIITARDFADEIGADMYLEMSDDSEEVRQDVLQQIIHLASRDSKQVCYMPNISKHLNIFFRRSPSVIAALEEGRREATKKSSDLDLPLPRIWREKPLQENDFREGPCAQTLRDNESSWSSD